MIDKSDQHWGALGTLLAGGLIYLMIHDHDHEGDRLLQIFKTLELLVFESAPALVIGYALAGIVPFLLTPTSMNALGHGGMLTQSIRGVVFGLPLPVCSCGVLPIYESLVRRGAPPVAALAFFVATPELGLDAVLLSVPLLGSSLTVARIVAAFGVALIVAMLVGRGLRSQQSSTLEELTEAANPSWTERLRAGAKFGFVEVFDHTMPWIAVGLLLAALAEPMLSHGVFENVPSFLHVPLAALVGVPVYVCASGATPIAALAIHKGLSSGAALTFLIAGPATNLTTFGVLAKLHSRKIALLFGISVTTLAMLAGWFVDFIGIEASAALNLDDTHAADPSVFSWICVVTLVLLVLSSLFRQGPRGVLHQLIEPIHSH